MLISLVSLNRSPGVSAACLALAWRWPRHALVAECDPTGGQSLGVLDPDGTCGRRGMFELMLAARSRPLHQALWGQAVTLPDGSGRHYLLPGPRSPREAESLHWPRLTGLFHELDPIDVLADCGRLRQRGTPHGLLAASDLAVLLVANNRHCLRTMTASLEVAREEAGLVGAGDDGLAVVVVRGDARTTQGFPIEEITRQLTARGVPVLGELPWDPSGAAQLTDVHRPGRRFDASPLLAGAERLAREIGRRALARRQRLRGKPQAPARHPVNGQRSPEPVALRHRERVQAATLPPVPRPPAGRAVVEAGEGDSRVG
ncbi:hypothetical protein [Amycolatopsis aidingensis]|uniref:hypothetical protein n=1 Tax=Amycolatopsis aidingensis TaxID=2842453 RepID=UPI001C0E831E|nr:hypothetical protein [Amycolatopsis aidingensis]